MLERHMAIASGFQVKLQAAEAQLEASRAELLRSFDTIARLGRCVEKALDICEGDVQ
jgi:hypothetical protein